ncbi:MAG: phosphatidate cytidylyltransferase [Christensenellaceae bacterium]|jgi:phosphatidate cytidylyltransferase|nr:phosphatidate cytidylyltransferase [Christensenellaceae bacterium]
MLDMLKRVTTGLLLGAYAIAMLLWGRYAILINLVLLMMIGVYEIVYVLNRAGFRPVAWIHYLTALLYIPAYMWRQEKGLILVLLCGFAACMAIACLTRAPGSKDLLATLLPSIYPSYAFVAFAMLALSDAPHWRLLLWMMLLSAVSCDICAMLVGSQFGKHKLIPKVSPKKTVEGAVAGFFGAFLSMVCAWAVFNAFGEPFFIGHFIAFGAIGGVATQIGDLVASYIKRFCGVKDYGTIFPGHGGVLDRLDGILFNAIAFGVYSMFFLL